LSEGAVPKAEDGLRRAIGEAHRRYTRHINFREGWRGHLWQGRFHSFPMDESYFLTAARYVELNPVRAKIVSRAEDYPWSSASAHLSGRNDILVEVAPLHEIVDDWAEVLTAGVEDQRLQEIRRHEYSGRPLGNTHFVEIRECIGQNIAATKTRPKDEE
jgi:REP-associated tyrosine transposase